MKTFSIKNAEIKEVIIQPDLPTVTVLYKLKDDEGNVIVQKTMNIEKDDIPTAGRLALDGMMQKLLAHILSKEEIT